MSAAANAACDARFLDRFADHYAVFLELESRMMSKMPKLHKTLTAYLLRQDGIQEGVAAGVQRQDKDCEYLHKAKVRL